MCESATHPIEPRCGALGRVPPPFRGLDAGPGSGAVALTAHRRGPQRQTAVAPSVHVGGVAERALMSQIFDLLRPGDVLAHCLSGAPNVAGEGTNIGHGGGGFDYTAAEVKIAQCSLPDTLSSDIHVFSGNSPGMPSCRG